MLKIQFEFSDDLILTAHGGLSVVGALLEASRVFSELNRTRLRENEHPTFSHTDVVKSYVGMLCQGKSDFDYLETVRDDDTFRLCLNLNHVPSSPTVRQRLDEAAVSNLEKWNDILIRTGLELIQRVHAPLTGVKVGNKTYIPLDIDVSPFDNSGTKKEGVSRTYKGVDGYAPIFAYLGQEGYGVHVELREGSTHVQKDTADFLAASILYARIVTQKDLLVRMDAGHDSLENLRVCQAHKVDYIIKVNLRRTNEEEWLEYAQTYGTCTEPREGKKEYIGVREVEKPGFSAPLRQVFHVIHRTMDRHGQILLVPDIEVNVYWTSLEGDPWRVVELYREHATSEQFHSEIKSDLDLERLPSGKFRTNDLVLHLGLLAYNLLRIIGQKSLRLGGAPLRKHVHRRRIKSVIQNMITIAVRVVRHARQFKFVFGKHSPWAGVVSRLYAAFVT